jgi:hypothetical protein
MIKNRVIIASALMSMLILSLAFIPAASEKSTIDQNNQSSNPFGVEMSDYLKQNIIQPDPYTFIAAPDIEDEDAFFAAWDDYEKEAFEQKRIDDKNVSTRDTITLKSQCEKEGINDVPVVFVWTEMGIDEFHRLTSIMLVLSLLLLIRLRKR